MAHISYFSLASQLVTFYSRCYLHSIPNFMLCQGQIALVIQCGSSRRSEIITLFKLPSPETEALKTWRKELLSVITRDRVVEKDVQKQTDNETVHVCPRHFTEE